MIKMKQQGNILRHLTIILVLVLVFSACATSSQKKDKSATQQTEEKVKESNPLYYDFGDVPIPPELKLRTKSSFVYHSSGFSAGVLVLRGRVELGSLIQFFESNMAKDNWRIVSTFKSPRTLLLFQKETRWCVINITDEKYSTHVEIWVAPTTNAATSGLLK